MARWVKALAVLAAASGLLVACASSEPESTLVGSNESESTARSESTSAPTTTLKPSTGSDAALPLYGAHVRRVPGVPQPRAGRPGLHEWYLSFGETGDWDGILELAYTGKTYVSWGRAYEYTSDRKTRTLHIGAATKTEGLRLGGFRCRPDDAATYLWSRFDRNYVLRLIAVEDPCGTRMAILEGEWQFLD